MAFGDNGLLITLTPRSGLSAPARITVDRFCPSKLSPTTCLGRHERCLGPVGHRPETETAPAAPPDREAQQCGRRRRWLCRSEACQPLDRGPAPKHHRLWSLQQPRLSSKCSGAIIDRFERKAALRVINYFRDWLRHHRRTIAVAKPSSSRSDIGIGSEVSPRSTFKDRSTNQSGSRLNSTMNWSISERSIGTCGKRT